MEDTTEDAPTPTPTPAVQFRKRGSNAKVKRKREESAEDEVEAEGVASTLDVVRAAQKLRTREVLAKRSASSAAINDANTTKPDVNNPLARPDTAPVVGGLRGLTASFNANSAKRSSKTVLAEAEEKRKREFIAAALHTGEDVVEDTKREVVVNDPRDSVLLLNPDLLSSTVHSKRVSETPIASAGLEELELPMTDRLKSARASETAKNTALKGDAAARANQSTHSYFQPSRAPKAKERTKSGDRVFSTKNTAK